MKINAQYSLKKRVVNLLPILYTSGLGAIALLKISNAPQNSIEFNRNLLNFEKKFLLIHDHGNKISINQTDKLYINFTIVGAPEKLTQILTKSDEAITIVKEKI